MEINTFQQLPTAQVAQLLQAAGSKVCAFLLNGTTRWTLMEHPGLTREQFADVYLAAIPQRAIAIYQLIFAHGFETLITPSLDMPITERGERYLCMAAQGLAQLATHPAFLEFYANQQVRVRFYGDYRQHFHGTPYAYLSELFDEVMAKTAHHQRHRFFFGLLAQEPFSTVAALAVSAYQAEGVIPDQQALITHYYGEPVAPVDLCIGFGKLDGFHIPLLTTGKEHLYFTVSPSAYLDQTQLRAILYDHLYARPKADLDYFALSAERWGAIQQFYQANRGRTLGIGCREETGVWLPAPQVNLPSALSAVN